MNVRDSPAGTAHIVLAENCTVRINPNTELEQVQASEV